MLQQRWANYVSALGLVIVLSSMAAFALWSALTTSDLAHNATRAASLNDQYQQATYWMSEENRAETLYRLRPLPANEEVYTRAGDNFLGAMRAGQALRTTTENDFATTIIALHAQYQAIVQQEFTALAVDDPARVTETSAQSDAAIADLERQVQQEAQRHHALALQRLAQLATTQRIIFVATPLIFVPGFGLVVFCFALLHISRRKTQAAREEALLRQIREEAVQTELVRLQHSSLTDNLTALGNHRAYQEAHQREVAQAQRYSETLSLALIDIDEFKQYNDQFGHAYGDHILTTFATVLRDAPLGENAFRLGGDEFAVLLRHTTMAEATQALETIRATVQHQIAGVTISIGIATLAPDAQNATILQEQADAALYEAKRRGRNALVTFAEIADHITLLTSAQAQALRQLIAEQRLSIVFQPIWDLAHQRTLGYEALMRPDSCYGFQGPQEAFDIAERMGHTHELDAVCRAAILARAHELPADALLFINVTPQTLDHDLLAGTTLAEAVQAAGLRPDQVVLEITERAIARPEVVVREASRLRRLGFQLALDDAGAGNAGLEMLSHLAVDYVKIDREVIVNAPADTAARAVLAGIIAIARETHSYVIAEGIEDQATLRFIQRMSMPEIGSVQGVQGYLMGRPSATMAAAAELLPAELPAA